ncbi:hypothetical protein HK405_004896 [Cladochytrium tenue]|nr:hypothetical protein HK405_004896 [Cladochytrium tenue]
MSAVQQPLTAPRALGHDRPSTPRQPRSHDSVGPIDAAAVLAAISAANLSPVYPSASPSSARSGGDSATYQSDSATVVSSVLAPSVVGSDYSLASSVVVKEYVANPAIGATPSPLRNAWALAQSEPQSEDNAFRSVSLETIQPDDCDAEDAQSAHVVASLPSISPQFVHASPPAGEAPSCAVSTDRSGQIRPAKFPRRRVSRRLPVAQRAAMTPPAVNSLHALDIPRSSSSIDADGHLWCRCHPVWGGRTFSGASRAFSEDLPSARHNEVPSRPRRQSEGGLRASQPRAAGGHWWQRVLASLKNLRLKRKVRERAEEGGDLQPTLEAHLVSMAEAATGVEPDADTSDATAATGRWNKVGIFAECEGCQGTQFLPDGTVCQDCVELAAGDGVPERAKFPLESFVRSPSGGQDPVLDMLQGDDTSVSSFDASPSGRPPHALAVWDMTRVASLGLGMVGVGAGSGAGAIGGANPIARAVQRLKPKRSIDSPPPHGRSLSLSSSSASPPPRRGSRADLRDSRPPRPLAPSATASPDSPTAWSARLALFSPRDVGRSFSFGSLSSAKFARAANGTGAATAAATAAGAFVPPPPGLSHADGDETTWGVVVDGRRLRQRRPLVSVLSLAPAIDGMTCVGPDSDDDGDDDDGYNYSGDAGRPPAVRRSATLPAPATPTTRACDSDGSTLASVPRSVRPGGASPLPPTPPPLPDLLFSHHAWLTRTAGAPSPPLPPLPPLRDAAMGRPELLWSCPSPLLLSPPSPSGGCTGARTSMSSSPLPPPPPPPPPSADALLFGMRGPLRA